MKMLLERLPGVQPLVCFEVRPSHPAADLARGIESAVFREFFNNTPDQLAEAYAPYEEASRWLLVLDRHRQRAAGCLRYIVPSAAGMKTLVDARQPPLNIPTMQALREHDIDLARCWDVGTLAVMPDHRGNHEVALELYAHIFHAARRNHVQDMLAVLDDHAYKQLHDVLGVPWVHLCRSGPVAYLGSAKSHAVTFKVAVALQAVDEHVAALPQAIRDVVEPLARRLHVDVLPIFAK